MSDEIKNNWIAGFWRRIGALFIDTILLGLFGFLLSMIFESVFVQIGVWGKLIGFVIALAYFGAMNSRVFVGQTVGKKILKLRVVNAENQTISIARSSLRYIVLAAPFSLNGIQIASDNIPSFLAYPLSLIVFGGLFSILYLYVFNRVTRQSLHDIFLGTYVVKADAQKEELGEVWKVHLIIVCLFFCIAAIVPALTSNFAKGAPFKEMFAVQSALVNERGVNFATISTNTSFFNSANDEKKTTTHVAVQAFLSSDNIEDVELARHLASIVVENYSDVRNKDNLVINLFYGYDIGIWSQWSSHMHLFKPNELNDDE